MCEWQLHRAGTSAQRSDAAGCLMKWTTVGADKAVARHSLVQLNPEEKNPLRFSDIGAAKARQTEKPNKRASHHAYFMSSFSVSLAVGIFTSIM